MSLSSCIVPKELALGLLARGGFMLKQRQLPALFIEAQMPIDAMRYKLLRFPLLSSFSIFMGAATGHSLHLLQFFQAYRMTTTAQISKIFSEFKLQLKSTGVKQNQYGKCDALH